MWTNLTFKLSKSHIISCFLNFIFTFFILYFIDFGVSLLRSLIENWYQRFELIIWSSKLETMSGFLLPRIFRIHLRSRWIRTAEFAKITKGFLYIAFDLYFFCCCSSGSRPALSSGVMKQLLDIPGRPALARRLRANLDVNNPNEAPKRENERGWPPPPKKIVQMKTKK